MSRLFGFLVFCFLLPHNYTYSQMITGKVIDMHLEPIIGATIWDINSSEGTATDYDGFFEIAKKDTPLVLVFSAIGYESDTITLDHTGKDYYINNPIVLTEKSEILNEIVISAKSPSTLIREQAYAVEVIESKKFKNLSTNANTILSRISGVNIRESGGLGSNFSLSLNGLSGNQVRIFLDGVPMDYFGSSLSLNNFAANIIKRIEVYKGVVPVHLSSDALGGAINVTTDNSIKDYLDASYSIGSFNTHIASVNGQFRLPKSGFTQRIKSFYNYSDNNYRVPVHLVDFSTGKKEEKETWLPRFHDGYESRMIWYEAGLTLHKYADEFLVGYLYSDNYKELQQAANAIGQASIPYGEVFTTENKDIINVKYRKKGLFNNKMSVSAYGVYIDSKTVSVDTASVIYDWYGNFNKKSDNYTGEIENRKTLLTLNTENLLANANSEYSFSPSQSVTVNYSLNDFTLQGSDPFKAQNNTQFAEPNKIRKQVLAASYTNSFLEDRFKATAFSKYYDYKINSIETNYSGTEIIPFTTTRNNVGYGFSATAKNKVLQLKLSYEKAIRFPEVQELFGDGLNVVPSPSLLPEKSDNFNVGVTVKTKPSFGSLYLSTNAFYRNASDFIIPVVQGIKVYHVNSISVVSKGIELSTSIDFRDKFIVGLNSTYLDLRDNNKWRNGEKGVENSLYKARIPNVPYFFNNMNLSYRTKNLVTERDRFSVTINQNYVHEFFFKWEALASKNKRVIPTQFSTNLNMVYSLMDEMYNIGFSINNLFDSKLYDNFQQIRPGRNFNIKFRYFIN